MWKIKFTNSDRDTNFADEIQDAVNRTIEKLQQSRKENHAIKINMALHVVFEKATDPSVVSDPPVVLPSEQ